MLLRTACIALAALLTPAQRAHASDDVVDLAASLIGRPYVWGAEGPNSFDCSGLTQYVFREFAIDLPRRAISQSKVGDRIGRRMQRGDLVFFANDARKSEVTHVAIYEGRGRMIEASKRYGRVRRSDLEEEYWAERFMFARRIDVDGESRDVDRSRPSERDEEVESPPGRKGAGRRAAVRALEELAGILIRRPRR